MRAAWARRSSPKQVESVTVAGGKATGVTTAQGPTSAGHVVIAAGAWSPTIGALPRALPVEPVRGQMAATPWPAGTPAAILYDGEGYVLARGDEALLGSTMEHSGFDCHVTNEGLAQIFRGAARLLPALMPAVVLRTWAGLRPLTPDGRPVVGRDPEARSPVVRDRTRTQRRVARRADGRGDRRPAEHGQDQRRRGRLAAGPPARGRGVAPCTAPARSAMRRCAATAVRQASASGGASRSTSGAAGSGWCAPPAPAGTSRRSTIGWTGSKRSPGPRGTARCSRPRPQVALIRWQHYDLVRVGQPPRVELAGWRYGERLKAREQERARVVVPLTVAAVGLGHRRQRRSGRLVRRRDLEFRAGGRRRVRRTAGESTRGVVGAAAVRGVRHASCRCARATSSTGGSRRRRGPTSRCCCAARAARGGRAAHGSGRGARPAPWADVPQREARRAATGGSRRRARWTARAVPKA